MPSLRSRGCNLIGGVSRLACAFIPFLQACNPTSPDAASSAASAVTTQAAERAALDSLLFVLASVGHAPIQEISSHLDLDANFSFLIPDSDSTLLLDCVTGTAHCTDTTANSVTTLRSTALGKDREAVFPHSQALDSAMDTRLDASLRLAIAQQLSTSLLHSESRYDAQHSTSQGTFGYSLIERRRSGDTTESMYSSVGGKSGSYDSAWALVRRTHAGIPGTWIGALRIEQFIGSRTRWAWHSPDSGLTYLGESLVGNA